MENIIKAMQQYRDLMQDKSLIKFYNPIKLFINRIKANRIAKVVHSEMDNLMSNIDYNSIRIQAQLFHYFFPGIGSTTIATGEEFLCSDISSFKVIPEITKVISDNYYVEIDMKITSIVPYISLIGEEVNCIYIFRESGTIDVNMSKVYKQAVFQRTDNLCIKNTKMFSFGSKNFIESTEYTIFEHAFLNTLKNYISTKIGN